MTLAADLTDADRAGIAAIWIGVHNADSMQTAAEQTYCAGWNAAIEAAARECDRLSTELRRDLHSVNGGAYQCATAVRALERTKD